jgi:glyoxylase-like metal-dependent hydrolase (beta-lactamase superfamily II)
MAQWPSAVLTDAPVVTVVREHHGPFIRYVMSAPTQVPGESFQMNAEVSVYQLGDVLIDAGPARFASALVDSLPGPPPRRILLTHQHEDHAGGALALREAFGGCEIFAPRSLVPVLAEPLPVDDYRLRYWGPIAPLSGVDAVDEGDTFTVLDISIEAVATPGHTPGHMAYLAHAGDRVYALTGDLLVSTRSLFGFYESSAEDLIASQRRLATIGAPLYLLPAHGRVRPDGALTLLRAADFLEAESATIRDAAARLGTVDPVAVALHLYGPPEPVELATGGDYSTAALVRSVLIPPRQHPVPRMDLPAAPLA